MEQIQPPQSKTSIEWMHYCIMHYILCQFLPPSNSAWSRAWWCLVWRKCGLFSEPRPGTPGPKHQPDINNKKCEKERQRETKRLFDYSWICQNSTGCPKKTWILVWWAIKGARSGMKNSGFYLSSEHKIMGLSEITHVTINPVLFVSLYGLYAMSN